MSSEKIRTLLIDDSAFIRRLIGDMIRNTDTLELVGIANDGKTGTEMAEALKPDVVVTDMVMPDFDGVYVVRQLMDRNPTPIILLSSLEKTDMRIFDALKCGAFDFIDKPRGAEGIFNGAYPLVELIHQAAQADVKPEKWQQRKKRNTNAHTFSTSVAYDIIVIGASTGGPGAIEYVVNNLPSNLSIPVVIAQHMPHRFLETFSARLNENAPMPVKLARAGDLLRGNTIYILPGEVNSVIEFNENKEVIIKSTKERFSEFNYPSIDCFFESVAKVYGSRSIGVILTGMGKDGTRGLREIMDSGGYTISQDEASSVVYGMPKSAFQHGASRQVLPLKEVPGFIVSCL
jgi:two-component system, chemotaxis family, protein-glutamate methylesterase/glutaminase